jgi:capsular exopolysaccharide synthesis family protein
MRRKRQSLVDHFHLETPFATEFRRLLKKIEDRRTERDLKSVLVSSAMLSEGKSTICAFLGLTAAAHKHMKTLIVDCDIRRPAVHRLFALEREGGLIEAVADNRPVRELIKSSGQEHLDVVTSGRHRDNPTEIFDPEKIATIIEELKFYYDLILIDAAPAIPVSDPMLLAPKVDGILLVIKAGSTQRQVVERAAGILDPGRRHLLGVVLNNLDNVLPYYYDSRYYGYHYAEKRRVSSKAVRVRERRRTRDQKPAKGTDTPEQSFITRDGKVTRPDDGST